MIRFLNAEIQSLNTVEMLPYRYPGLDIDVQPRSSPSLEGAHRGQCRGLNAQLGRVERDPIGDGAGPVATPPGEGVEHASAHPLVILCVQDVFKAGGPMGGIPPAA